MLLGSYCGNLTALISAHQSIGVPQPLILFGTEEQKRRFLPRVAGGEISAFALTEPKVGSDPAKMETTREPDARWKALHHQRREALVHERHQGGRHADYAALVEDPAIDAVYIPLPQLPACTVDARRDPGRQACAV